ncbi:MAG: exodeoxyribonuclease VII small subunit [Chloroherpetonaceae bacterium]|nr:exodeoxyribonuclease VII small subunit [Chloroherpetonaceae bacterium]MCS7210701.1 exodeoxyribonuclease VII small subunit [Chloroherpetonaceae bacterium]MDW8019658.1 exodeoxyribonuclease VII small subunit [Chloroherpetonaceae bacterium]MDW8464915.1 exodeoxyribonuclease VII small subunit [Chloroherpetonaceae bacterium]
MPRKKTDAETTEQETLEALVARLEEIVGLIQSGQLGLEKSVELYEEGQRIAKICEARLNALQQRIEIVSPLPTDLQQARNSPDPLDSYSTLLA